MLKLHHLVDKSLTLLADQVGGRHSDIVKKKFGRVTDTNTQLVQFSTHLDTGRIG